ncbi:MAG: thioredoxin [Firmicutes bacterium]|jgi:thioredoxin 1|nr:thioredoxin [Bacillota bacterium]
MAVMDLNADEFAAKVEGGPRPVLVDFWAPWCAPCRMVSPIVEELAEEMADRLDAYKVNVDEAPELAARFGIMSIPTLGIWRGGRLVNQVVGYRPKAHLREFLERELSH